MPLHDGARGQAEVTASHDEPPPILGSWRNLYTVVLLWLTILIVVFYFFTEYFS